MKYINSNLTNYVNAPLKGGVKEINNELLRMMTYQASPSTLTFV